MNIKSLSIPYDVASMILGVEAEITGGVVLKRLSNVQHLYNEITAHVSKDLDVLQLLKELHPSPAVGGSPRSAACQRIRHYENFDRGLYAGPIGWVNSSFEESSWLAFVLRWSTRISRCSMREWG